MPNRRARLIHFASSTVQTTTGKPERLRLLTIGGRKRVMKSDLVGATLTRNIDHPSRRSWRVGATAAVQKERRWKSFGSISFTKAISGKIKT